MTTDRHATTGRPSPRVPQLFRDVAPGLHRLAHANVNCSLLVDGDDVTIVDAAFPAT